MGLYAADDYRSAHNFTTLYRRLMMLWCRGNIAFTDNIATATYLSHASTQEAQLDFHGLSFHWQSGYPLATHAHSSQDVSLSAIALELRLISAMISISIRADIFDDIDYRFRIISITAIGALPGETYPSTFSFARFCFRHVIPQLYS